MSKIHILERANDKEIKVLFHYPVRSEENESGLFYQEIFKKEDPQEPFDTGRSVEMANISNSEVIERIKCIPISRDLGKKQILDEIKDAYIEEEKKVEKLFYYKYRFYGTHKNF